MPTLARLPDNARAVVAFTTAKNQAHIAAKSQAAGDPEAARGMFKLAHLSLVRALFLNTHRGPISVE
jgi:hypothetical protein